MALQPCDLKGNATRKVKFTSRNRWRFFVKYGRQYCINSSFENYVQINSLEEHENGGVLNVVSDWDEYVKLRKTVAEQA